MSSSKAKSSAKSLTTAAAHAAPSGAAREGLAPGPIDLFAAGDAWAARRAARAILADEQSSAAQREQARALQERCAADRPTLYLLAIAWAAVLAIAAALYLF